MAVIIYACARLFGRVTCFYWAVIDTVVSMVVGVIMMILTSNSTSHQVNQDIGIFYCILVILIIYIYIISTTD